MEKIEFTIADGSKCTGYLFKWKGLSFALTKNPSKSWTVIELQTGCPITDKKPATRKKALKQAVELLDSKGVKTVKQRIKEVFTERGSLKVKGRIKTAHCTETDNLLKCLCGKDKDLSCIPAEYFSLAKKPCKRCKKILQSNNSNLKN
jgi:hypothetical protein